MVSVQTVVEGIINLRNGWAVTEQFTSTYEGGEPFEDQNYNAMELIASEVDHLLKSEVLADSYEVEELRQYHKRLEGYLSQA